MTPPARTPTPPSGTPTPPSGTATPPRGTPPAPVHFADRLESAIQARRSCLVVGLDPVLERLPAEVLGQVRGLGAARGGGEGWSAPRAAAALGLFGREVVEAVAGSAVAVKPNCAFFERFGAAGWDVLQDLCRRAREAGLLTIVDGKRNDLESTAEAYAEGLLGDLADTLGPVTDAVTVNPYLGSDGLRPFLAAAARHHKGIFVLVRTSNPSAAELQDLDAGGRPLYLRAAELVDRWGADLLGECGLSAVGAVVGATVPERARAIRQALPRAPFLVPGYGAQGAGAEEVRPHFLPGGRGAVVNASRSVIFAHEKDRTVPWREAISRAAERAREELERVRGSA